MDDYRKMAEENLVQLQAYEEASNKRMLSLEVVVGYTSSVSFLALVFTASFAEMPAWARALLIGVGLVLFDESLDERSRIPGVVDGERLREAELLGLAAQDADARGVERRDPHALRRLTDDPLDALAHLARGLVGEGDRQDLARPGLSRPQERRDAAREHAGLARTCTRHDEQSGPAIGHSLELLRIEAGEQIVFYGAEVINTYYGAQGN
jgi:hypothetical protein